MPLFRRLRAAALALLPVLAACQDSVTGPRSFVQQAGGATWVAVLEPAGMADASTWEALVPDDASLAARMDALRDDARAARAEGRLEDAFRADDARMRLAAASLASDPAPARVLAAAAALEAWVQRARERLETGAFPALADAADRADAEVRAARAAAAAGDLRTAALRVTEGTLAARAHTPLRVGLRLLAAAEARLADAPAGGEDVERARHLLRDAREGLTTGDPLRSLRRALYAMQLLDGAASGR